MTKYWFKRKRYGYGWKPVTWEGWLSVGLYVFIVVGGLWAIRGVSDKNISTLANTYSIVVLLATVLLIVLGHKYGPKPKWRWGKSPQDNPEEDL